MVARIGFDVGNVIAGGNPSIFSDHYLATPEIAGAFEAVAHAVSLVSPENVFIISRCSPNTQRRTQDWLLERRFYLRTGMLVPNVIFCSRVEDKAFIAERRGIHAFIDDRPDVLLPMAPKVPLRICFNPRADRLAQHKLRLGSVYIVRRHSQVIPLLSAFVGQQAA